MKIATPILLTLVLINASFAEDLNCLTDKERAAAQLYSHLQRQAYDALDRRDEVFEGLDSTEKIQAYQKKLRAFFIKQLGGFPERTPLNSRTVKTIKADGYRIEFVIFESQPNHHITANLYLPDSDGPVPAVAVSSGHSRTGKTAAYNQRFGIIMAKHGMAALCFDPIGQGERSQILNESGQPEFNGTTTEHFLIGVGSTLVGRSTARYRVWDAMRAIDYLISRPEIDGSKIGFTGCSGGGTLTSYVMALDDRVTCAAPACYLTTLRRLIETQGPQDAEQNVFGQVAFGLDHPDYVILRAPKPTLISATTGDFFDIKGTWDNFRQSKRIYTNLGYPERVDLVEAPGKHGVQPRNLAMIAQWMKRWLLDKDAAVDIAELPTREPEELLCLDRGQVLLLSGEKSVFELNADYERTLAKQRQQLWKKESRDELTKRIAARIGMRSVSELKPPKWKDKGRVNRDGYHIDRLVLETDTGIPLPGLTYHPPTPSDEAYLYLHDDGKLGDGQKDGPIEKLVEDGYAVVAVDLRGQGETRTRAKDALLTDWKTYYLSYLLGKPLLGLRVEDALAAADFVAYYQKDRKKPRKVHLVGVGRAGIIALHAAAMSPELFESVTLKDTPKSWASIVKQPVPRNQLDAVVHGALELYDLPDLVRLVGESKIKHED